MTKHKEQLDELFIGIATPVMVTLTTSNGKPTTKSRIDSILSEKDQVEPIDDQETNVSTILTESLFSDTVFRKQPRKQR